MIRAFSSSLIPWFRSLRPGLSPLSFHFHSVSSARLFNSHCSVSFSSVLSIHSMPHRTWIAALMNFASLFSCLINCLIDSLTDDFNDCLSDWLNEVGGADGWAGENDEVDDLNDCSTDDSSDDSTRDSSDDSTRDSSDDSTDDSTEGSSSDSSGDSTDDPSGCSKFSVVRDDCLPVDWFSDESDERMNSLNDCSFDCSSDCLTGCFSSGFCGDRWVERNDMRGEMSDRLYDEMRNNRLYNCLLNIDCSPDCSPDCSSDWSPSCSSSWLSRDERSGMSDDCLYEEMSDNRLYECLLKNTDENLDHWKNCENRNEIDDDEGLRPKFVFRRILIVMKMKFS